MDKDNKQNSLVQEPENHPQRNLLVAIAVIIVEGEDKDKKYFHKKRLTLLFLQLDSNL
jgi:hypothetical protein